MALAVLSVGVGLVRRNRWSVRQDIDIAAPLTTVRPLIETLRRWPEWLPSMRELDPHARRSYSGPQEGVGSSASWLGTTVGMGRMTVISSTPGALVLEEAIESDTVNAQATFTFSQSATGTHVTWVDEGTLPRPFGSYFTREVESELTSAMGNGLAKLKSLTEAEEARARAQAESDRAKAEQARAAADAGISP